MIIFSGNNMISLYTQRLFAKQSDREWLLVWLNCSRVRAFTVSLQYLLFKVICTW